jgi:hypothetical protein
MVKEKEVIVRHLDGLPQSHEVGKLWRHPGRTMVKEEVATQPRGSRAQLPVRHPRSESDSSAHEGLPQEFAHPRDRDRCKDKRIE